MCVDRSGRRSTSWLWELAAAACVRAGLDGDVSRCPSPERCRRLARRLLRRASHRWQSNGIVRAMRATIDKAGRLVIPRVLRDRVGLVAGGEVELAVDGAGVRIDPVADGGLEEEDGFLVIPDSVPVTREMIRELIDADRHAR